MMIDDKVFFDYKEKAEKYEKLRKAQDKINANHKKYYHDRNEKFKKYYNDYYHNPEKKAIINAIHDRYYEKNREKIKERSKMYYLANKDKMLKQAKERNAKIKAEKIKAEQLKKDEQLKTKVSEDKI